MSLETIQRFKCDRCGSVLNEKHYVDIPKTWMELHLFTDDTTVAQPMGKRQLCMDCTTGLMKYLAKE